MTKSLDMKGRSILTLHDISDSELTALVDLAAEMKERRRTGTRGTLLERKSVVLLFEKMSTRTRCAATVAAADEGGRAEYLSCREIHLGSKESVADTARVLGRMFDSLLFRGYLQETVALLAEHAGVPVWNGLTDDAHPTQVFADLLTVKERFGRLQGLKLVYLGDGRNNMVNSLMLGCAKSGMDFVNCTPVELTPPADVVEGVSRIAARSGGSVTVADEPVEAVRGANVVYTDVWASMGEESEFEKRAELLRPYQVNMTVMDATGNLDAGEAVFLHCLPAFHDDRTELTRDIGALEVTDEVFEAPFSLVFEQAENRMHTMKALFVATL